MSSFSADLAECLKQACEYAEDQTTWALVTVVELPDVRAIRRGLLMSQHVFAGAWRIPLATLNNWEQGRRVPDVLASDHLKAIA